MRGRTWRLLLLLVTVTMLASVAVPASAGGGGNGNREVRFATFNASLNRSVEGALMSHLSTPDDPQAQAVAEIIQRTAPDVLLVNEFDYDEGGVAAVLFQDNYLSVSQGGAEPIEYPYRIAFPSNTGIHSSQIVGLPGLDFNKDGIINPVPDQGFPGFIEYGDDSLGFGAFPGQFAFVVYSMYPIDDTSIRTFQHFLWKDMPGALLPVNADGTSFYTEDELDIFRLSSKNHADVPIMIGNKVVHFLVSHPTPPVFDGPEDRNGTRNSDEIRFWADYVGPGASKGAYIYDDEGNYGGLKPGSLFVIAGDQNADPFDGDSVPGAAQQLLEHPLVNTKATPDSKGGVEQAALQGNANTLHIGDPAFDTADFFDGFPPSPFGGAPGNLRVDYVLPRKTLQITDAGVFWPTTDDPQFPLVGTFPFPSSDHRLVWVDVRVPGRK